MLMVMCRSITVHAGGASDVGREGGRLMQPEPLMQAAQRAGCPPVGRAEQGHGGRDEDAANQAGVHRDGDGQGQAEFLDAESLAGGEAEEHDDDQECGASDDPSGALQAGGDGVVGVAGLVVGLLDPGQQDTS
jgi:hypothetical protein